MMARRCGAAIGAAPIVASVGFFVTAGVSQDFLVPWPWQPGTKMTPPARGQVKGRKCPNESGHRKNTRPATPGNLQWRFLIHCDSDDTNGHNTLNYLVI